MITTRVQSTMMLFKKYLNYPQLLPTNSILKFSTSCLSSTAKPIYADKVAERSTESLLFTPGPLTTSKAVKEAMLKDFGSRDTTIRDATASIRRRILTMAGTSVEAGFETVIVQGSGSFAVESVLSSVIPSPEKGGKLLILSNGSYGDRMADMAKRAGIELDVVREDENKSILPSHVEEFLKGKTYDKKEPYTHVAVVHHETTAGVLNPIKDIGNVVKKNMPNCSYIVDSMSAFGAYPVNMIDDSIDYLVSSANKNIEGVPGFSFAICNNELLQRDGVHARTVTLDLLGQLNGLNETGQFRFTPPTHILMAFQKALDEHEEEGGVNGRLKRYERNASVLLEHMNRIGFTPYVENDDIRGCIITTFSFPKNDKHFIFNEFYRKLSVKGYIIYPGKLAGLECFRIGSIGKLYEKDMINLVGAIEEVLVEMGVTVPVTM
jgi:2-aminoethylphosphonate-pyruvate transaminase